ncbi:MAG TPA: GAF domain-containing protein [Trebonia sp.]|jgi:signal transduction histidine kinase
MTSGTSDPIAREQAALRRVATLVARAAPPEEVFTAVTAEAGRLLEVDITFLVRYDQEDMITVVGTWSRTGEETTTPLGSRFELGGRNVTTQVVKTSQPARMDYAETGASGPIGSNATDEIGLRSSSGAPISVDGRLWGALIAASTTEAFLPADTETRLAGFTELVATAVANTQARVELRGFAEEQAALRRVATLVAGAATPEDVLAAVAGEVGRLLNVDYTALMRSDPDNMITLVGTWASTGGVGAAPSPVGSRFELGGRNMSTLVLRSGQPVRLDAYEDVTGTIGATGARIWGFRSSVGAPISVHGRPWGLILVAYTRDEPLPADTETRLAGFTELIATAVANTQARIELRKFAEQQAALRRVATLVARAAPPEEVFTAVTAEAGRLLEVDITILVRYDQDDMITIVGTWTNNGIPPPSPLGSRFELGGRNVTTLVIRTGEPAQTDYAETGASGPIGGTATDEWGLRSSSGAPISVDGRLWGVLIAASTTEAFLSADTDTRLAEFTELVGTALANTEAQAALTASRARIVTAADTARRRIERDLHDGAQQRLVSLALQLRSSTQASPRPGADALAAQMDQVAEEITGALGDLREIARGIHPAILAEGGLRPALTTLARRSAVPVRLDLELDRRLPDPVELAAYYVINEALANTAKHAHAASMDVRVAANGGLLRIYVRDDGDGGADPAHGTGLVGLIDRVEALGGQLTLRSSPGTGTTVDVALPLTDRTLPMSRGSAGLTLALSGPPVLAKPGSR